MTSAQQANSEIEESCCLVCLERIGIKESVWQCSKSCCQLFHLVCIQAWARKQLQSAQEKQRAQEDAKQPEIWGCPNCRAEFGVREVPSRYTCYCGKVEDPPFDPWLPPHSCGGQCDRQLPTCEHHCSDHCHPHKCPPCPRIVTSSCHCGKKQQQKRCSLNQAWSCKATCSRTMPCGHTCPQVCHAGKCPPCQVVGQQRCRCGSQAAAMPCHEQPDFRCATPCGALLDCGRHKCTAVCCDDKTHACPLNRPRPCACGKTLQEVPCSESVPGCGDTCDRLLPCGLHRCEERCGTPCPDKCRRLVTKQCACGSTSKLLPCSETFRCEKRCSKMRSCGRHQCKKRCCGDAEACQRCTEVCNRKLACGNHLCPASCHRGPCQPCPLKSTVTCACGQTRAEFPCGAPATPPACEELCPVPRLCRHAAQLPGHLCHFGPCPPCNLPCGTQLHCSHTCSSSSCHDATPPPVPPFVQPLPPRSGLFPSAKSLPAAKETEPAAMQAAAACPPNAQTPCIPCVQPVEVACVGGHQVAKVACKDAAPFACNQPCGARLACSNCTCSRPCHPRDTGDAEDRCEECTKTCSRSLPGCGHTCPLRCHPGPCSKCSAMTTHSCFCGQTQIEGACSTLSQAAGCGGPELCCSKECGRPIPACGHPCTLKCHPGACLTPAACETPVTLRCPCRRRRMKVPCNQVDKTAESNDPTAPPSLACDRDCETAKAKKKSTADSTAPPRPAEATSDPAPVSRDSPAVPDKGEASSARQRLSQKAPALRTLSRAERRHLAEQERLAQEREESRRKLLSNIKMAAAYLVTIGLVVLLSWAAISLL